MDVEGIQFLQVTNTGKGLKRFKARFHGEEYDFQIKVPVTLPMDAARHIFGVGEDDKLPAFHRLGWVNLTADMEVAMEKLRAMKFEPIEQVYELKGARDRRQAALEMDPEVVAPGAKAPDGAAASGEF
jgi:hypothetical protein